MPKKGITALTDNSTSPPDTYPDDHPPAETDITRFACTEDDNPEALMSNEEVAS